MNDENNVRIGDLHYERVLWEGVLKATARGRIQGRSNPWR
jgi:hypothetical protein